MDPLSRSLGAAIRAAPVSRRALARAAKVSPALLDFIVQGERAATPPVARAVARALDTLARRCARQARAIERAVNRAGRRPGREEAS